MRNKWIIPLLILLLLANGCGKKKRVAPKAVFPIVFAQIDSVLVDTDSALVRTADTLARRDQINPHIARELMKSMLVDQPWILKIELRTSEGDLFVEPSEYEPPPVDSSSVDTASVALDSLVFFNTPTTGDFPALSEPYLFRPSDQYVVDLSRPVRAPGGVNLGTITATLPLANVIGDVFEARTLSARFTGFAIDLNGILLYQPDYRLVGLNLFSAEEFFERPDLVEVGRIMLEKPEGLQKVQVQLFGDKKPKRHTLHWGTISLHDTDWRIGIIDHR